MKNTGMNRKLDVLGRIVIPAEIRKSLSLVEGGQLEISLDEWRIILEPTKDSCALCGGRNFLHQFGDKSVCSSCREGIVGQAADANEVVKHLRAAQ